MKIAVRSGNLESDRGLVIDFLARHHTSDSTPERYEWLYCNSPAGEARVAICYDQETGVTIGVAAAFPRQFYVEDGLVPGWVLGDFCIANAYRALGPALVLQRALLADLKEAGGSRYYDFPSVAMTAVYQKLGIVPNLQLARMVKVLRLNRRVQKLVRNFTLANVLSSVTNVGISLIDRATTPTQQGSLVLHEGEIEKEFTDIARRVGSPAGICLWRSAEYLRWRYREHPYREYAIHTIRRDKILQGYCVVHQDGPILNLVDLFGISASIPAVLGGVIVLARAKGCESVAAEVSASHSFLCDFKKAGFVVRGYFPIIADCHAEVAERKPANWLLMTGDRES